LRDYRGVLPSRWRTDADTTNFSFKYLDVFQDSEEASRVTSQLKIVVRRMYSSPPINGSRIVTALLSDKALKAEWLKDVKGMADR
jgi:aspartate/tyrosine/aromatic aminotransferase